MKKVIYQVLDKANKNAKMSLTYLDETGEIKQQCLYQENFGEYLLEKERAYKYYAQKYLEKIFDKVIQDAKQELETDAYSESTIEDIKHNIEPIKEIVLTSIQINKAIILDLLEELTEEFEDVVCLDCYGIIYNPDIVREIEEERKEVIKENTTNENLEIIKAIKKYYPTEFDLFSIHGRVANKISHKTWTNEYTWEEVVEDFEKLKEIGDATDFLNKYSPNNQKEQLEKVGTVLDGNENLIQDGRKIEDYLLEMLEYVDSTIDGITNFYKRLEKNVDPYIKTRILYWLKGTYEDDYKKIKITPEGNLIAFKGVEERSGIYYSIQRGIAIADGVRYDRTQIPQVGIIEMPREEVAADPDSDCSYGLHFGAWNHANLLGRGKVIEVEIEPEDIVSIPIDLQRQQMRCCKYTVLGRVQVD